MRRDSERPTDDGNGGGDGEPPYENDRAISHLDAALAHIEDEAARYHVREALQLRTVRLETEAVSDA